MDRYNKSATLAEDAQPSGSRTRTQTLKRKATSTDAARALVQPALPATTTRKIIKKSNAKRSKNAFLTRSENGSSNLQRPTKIQRNSKTESVSSSCTMDNTPTTEDDAQQPGSRTRSQTLKRKSTATDETIPSLVQSAVLLPATPIRKFIKKSNAKNTFMPTNLNTCEVELPSKIGSDLWRPTKRPCNSNNKSVSSSSLNNNSTTAAGDAQPSGSSNTFQAIRPATPATAGQDSPPSSIRVKREAFVNAATKIQALRPKTRVIKKKAAPPKSIIEQVWESHPYNPKNTNNFAKVADLPIYKDAEHVWNRSPSDCIFCHNCFARDSNCIRLTVPNQAHDTVMCYDCHWHRDIDEINCAPINLKWNTCFTCHQFAIVPTEIPDNVCVPCFGNLPELWADSPSIPFTPISILPLGPTPPMPNSPLFAPSAFQWNVDNTDEFTSLLGLSFGQSDYLSTNNSHQHPSTIHECLASSRYGNAQARSDDDLRSQYNHKRNFTGPRKDQLNRVQHSVVQLWRKLSTVDPSDLLQIENSIVKHATSTLARTVFNMDNFAAYQATAHSVRDVLIERWNLTQQTHTLKDPKRVYYLSLEFLLGRSLDNALLSIGLKQNYGTALTQLGFKMEDLLPEEEDAALGNGGLGRLAACYMDSFACLEYPAWGYGLRYSYGIFKQNITDGHQTEIPDYWLNYGNPWEVPRLDVVYEVRFHGHCTRSIDAVGMEKWKWEGGDVVRAVAYDVPIPGFNNQTCLNIRLWSSKPSKQFDLGYFNAGNYEKSVQEQQKAENITSILYPNDNHNMGKELRLKQQYFLVCATLKDIIRRFKKTNRPWSDFPDQVAVQLNDTHPTMATVELQRRLVDLEGLEWDEAWDIVTRTFAFTNHTVLPEALETWPVPLMQDLLPRHMMIIFDINLFFLQRVEKKFPNDRERLARMSIIEESSPQRIRMAHLAVIASHTVNGVAALHSSLVKNVIFKDFAEFYDPNKFTNVTNGITPRRWLNQANPDLAQLITLTIGDSWQKDLTHLKKLEKFVDDSKFQDTWRAIKQANKQRLSDLIVKQQGIQVNTNAMFDVQVKRIHEYKRQLMNILGVIYRYFELKKMPDSERTKVVPRVVIFGGKAAPGYFIAKLIILLINNVSKIVNADIAVNKYLQVVFVRDYNVSLAETIVPAADISQHISTAGTEASGTSNMKFVLNSSLIVGTVDGANIEIGTEIGKENIYFFGALAHEVEDIRHAQRYRSVAIDPKLDMVLNAVSSGQFDCADTSTGPMTPAGTVSHSQSIHFGPLVQTLTTGGDFYLVSHDFSAYLATIAKAESEYRNPTKWTRKCILATAGMGFFSADRSVAEYAQRIWNIQACPLGGADDVQAMLASDEE